MIRSLMHMFFPALCAACGQPLHSSERMICFGCRYRLPRTHFHLQRGNPIEQIFWGRVPLKAASAYYYFRKEGRVQRLLHQLKYKGAAELGREVGRMYGRDLSRSPVFSSATLVVPVPLAAEKQRIRGYNQSTVFAEGIAERLQLDMQAEGLRKIQHNETQTRKSRYARWENVSGIYQVNTSMNMHGKNVLLVDDVVTTGATLESCARALLQSGAESVSIACIAAALRNY
jgi:ComF family protein